MKTEEKETIEQVNEMCIESLPPDLFELWEKIKDELFKNRKQLKTEKMTIKEKLLNAINSIHDDMKNMTSSGSCGEYGGEVDFDSTEYIVNAVLKSEIVGCLLNMFWQRNSEACPLECTESENEEYNFKEWVKTIDLDYLLREVGEKK